MEASIYYGTLPLIMTGPVISYGKRGELDSARYEILVDASEGESALVGLGIGEDAEVTIGNFQSMWLQTVNEEPDGDLVTKLSVTLIGLAKAGDKKKRVYGTNGREVGVGEDGRIVRTPIGIGQHWNIKEPVITVREIYFSTTAPDTSQVGKAVTPDAAPPVPDYLWRNFSKIRYNYPKGWVLDNREGDQVCGEPGGAGLWRIEDTYGFYQPGQPI